MKYRSKFEQQLGEDILKDVPYESERHSYKIMEERTYTPDWVYTKGKKKIYFEAKGRFRTRDEMKMYSAIGLSLLKNKIDFVFIFQNPKVPIPKARKRKDGTKFSISEWADKHKFKWCTKDTLSEFLK